MRVLAFGTYERDYPRNRQVISSLRRTGVDVLEFHEPVWQSEHKWSVGWPSVVSLVRAEGRLLTRRRPPRDFDAVLVGYPGHADVWAARRVAGGAPVVLNPLVSLWETFVVDRRRFSADSLAAKTLKALDRRAFGAADLVVADTEANADYWAELAGLPRSRFASCFVGAEERLFSPGWQPEEPPLFVGKLIPLHGLQTILEAARRLTGRRLRIVGSGQLEHLLAALPANVLWEPWLPYEELPAAYRRAACALGIFGTGPKAARVIPNKVFHALATGTPVITADTPGARELLEDGVSALLVPPGDPSALAAALERLMSDPNLARGLGRRGNAVYRELASEDVLGRRWRGLLAQLA